MTESLYEPPKNPWTALVYLLEKWNEAGHSILVTSYQYYKSMGSSAFAIVNGEQQSWSWNLDGEYWWQRPSEK
jgi:hypothetical protein